MADHSIKVFARSSTRVLSVVDVQVSHGTMESLNILNESPLHGRGREALSAILSEANLQHPKSGTCELCKEAGANLSMHRAIVRKVHGRMCIEDFALFFCEKPECRQAADVITKKSTLNVNEDRIIDHSKPLCTASREVRKCMRCKHLLTSDAFSEEAWVNFARRCIRCEVVIAQNRRRRAHAMPFQ